MSKSTKSTANATATKEPKAKTTKATKAPKAPKETKPKAAKGTVENTEKNFIRTKDLPWVPKKVTLFKFLKKMGAVSPVNAVSSKAVAEKSGLSQRDVRHYAYHAKAAGLVEVTQSDDFPGYGFYLTKKGIAINPDAEYKAVKKPGT